MAGANPGVAVQQQVRENAQELNDFLRGFASWQRDITKKDKQLIQAAAEAASVATPNTNATSQGKSDGAQTNGDSVDGGGSSGSGSSHRRRPIGSHHHRLNSPPLSNVPSPLKAAAVDSKASSLPRGKKNNDPPASKVVAKSLKFDTSTSQPGAAAAAGGGQEVVVKSSDDAAAAGDAGDALIRKQEACAEKDRGNEHFKAGRYDAAVESYTRGIKADPTNAILPANRAMALLKKGLNFEAEADCTLAISLDPTYVKAYQRRATARQAILNLTGAIKDFKKVLELEPSNKQAKAEINKIVARIEADRRRSQQPSGRQPQEEEEDKKRAGAAAGQLPGGQPKPSAAKAENKPETSSTLNVKENLKAMFKSQQPSPGQVFPVEKKPHQRSKKPLRRVEITETNGNDAADVAVATKQTGSGSSGDFMIRESKTTTTTTTTTKAATATATATASSSSSSSSPPKKTKIQIVEVTSSSSSSVEPPSSSSTTPSSDCPQPSLSVEVSPPSTTLSESSAAATASKSSAPVRKVEEDILQAAEKSSSASRPAPPSKTTRPSQAKVTSSTGFYAAWKELGSSSDAKFAFLERQMRTAESYPALFNHSLEPAVFEDIVGVLHDHRSSGTCLSRHLIGLSKVPRVSAMVMFMTNPDQLKELVDIHVVKNELDKDVQKSVVKCFM